MRVAVFAFAVSPALAVDDLNLFQLDADADRHLRAVPGLSGVSVAAG